MACVIHIAKSAFITKEPVVFYMRVTISLTPISGGLAQQVKAAPLEF